MFNTDTNRLETFQVSRPRNGGAASIKGFELTYQNQIWNGFGIQANYTFSYASSDGVTPLPFNSRHSFNLTPYYENDWLSARITYGYRTKYFVRSTAPRRCSTTSTTSSTRRSHSKCTRKCSLPSRRRISWMSCSISMRVRRTRPTRPSRTAAAFSVVSRYSF